MVSVGDLARRQALQIQQNLVGAGVRVLCQMGPGSMKNQFKRADKSGAEIALIVGEQEADANTVNIKLLRSKDNGGERSVEQRVIRQNDVVNAVTNLLESL